jgi:hypothetical protein
MESVVEVPDLPTTPTFLADPSSVQTHESAAISVGHSGLNLKQATESIRIRGRGRPFHPPKIVGIFLDYLEALTCLTSVLKDTLCYFLKATWVFHRQIAAFP